MLDRFESLVSKTSKKRRAGVILCPRALSRRAAASPRSVFLSREQWMQWKEGRDRWYQHRLSRGRSMLQEWAKLGLLAVLAAVVAWSSLSKYMKTVASQRIEVRTLSPDYDLYCAKYSAATDGTYDSCRSTIDDAITEATTSCAGYLDKEAACKSSYGRTSGKCQASISAVDGCVALVCTTALSKNNL